MVERSTGANWISQEGGSFAALLFFCVLIFAVLPFVRLVIAALAPGWTWNPEAALAIITSRTAMTAAWNTIETAMISGIGALALGTAFALALTITDMRGKRALAFLFVITLLIAPQVAALAFKTLAGPASPVLNMIGLAPPPGTRNPLLGRVGIMLVLALHHAPLAAITLAPGLRAIPNSLIEAAQLDGAPPVIVLRRIVLPLLRPYLIMAGLLVFVAGVGNFGIPALLGLPVGYSTLPTLIYRQLSSFGPSGLADAAALSALVALIAGIAVAACVMISGRGATHRDADVAMAPFWRLGLLRRPVEALSWLLVGVCCLLPLVSLVAMSIVPSYGMDLTLETITIDKFVEVLVRQDVTARAFRNSFLFAGTTSTILAMLAIVVAYALERVVGNLRQPLEVVIEIPYALPGVVLAIACVLLFLRPLPIIGISIYATPFIIVFAYLARFLPLALKAPLAAMAVFVRDQEEAAAMDGANGWQRLWYIVIPNLLPAAAAGALLVFLISFNELTVSALLWSSGTETLGVALLSLEDAGFAGEAAAIGVTTTIIVGLIMLGLDRFSSNLPPGVLPWAALAAFERRGR